MSSGGKRVFISAGEYSGSLYAARVVEQFCQDYPEVYFEGIGGSEMAEVGVKLLYNSDKWGSIGIIEALKRWRLIGINLSVQRYIRKTRPDLLVLIDYPGFNMHLVRLAAKIGIPTVYLFPPRKFATDPSEIRDAASTIKRVAAEFAPTYEVYRKAGADVEFVGHPALDALPVFDRQHLRREYGLAENEKLVLLMPGSRAQEIELLLPLFGEVLGRLCKDKELHGLRFHVLGAENLSSDILFRSRLEGFVSEMQKMDFPVHLFWKDRFAHMGMADMAFVASGTVTLELTIYEVPMLICYKVSLLTEFLARFHHLPKYIGLPNLLANRQLVPEYVQSGARAEPIAEFMTKMLKSERLLSEFKDELKTVRPLLGEAGSIAKIQRIMCEELGFEQRCVSAGES
jgi:lipid-A-disaccharide synthase